METITKPNIAEELLEELQAKTAEEKQVIVHCCVPAVFSFGEMVRIWKSTYLIDRNSGHRSKLLFWENISVFPYWTQIPAGKDYWFTLLFQGLPKDCKTFDLVEEIPEKGGFFVEGILRNQTDVYRVNVV